MYCDSIKTLRYRFNLLELKLLKTAKAKSVLETDLYAQYLWKKQWNIRRNVDVLFSLFIFVTVCITAVILFISCIYEAQTVSIAVVNCPE